MTPTTGTNLEDYVSTNCNNFIPLTKKDVAGILKVSVRTVENWRKEGRIPNSVDIGGRVYWHPEEFFSGLTKILRPDGNAQVLSAPPKPQVKKEYSSEPTAAMKRAIKTPQQLLASMR